MEMEIGLDMQGAYDAMGMHLNECALKNNYKIPQDFTFIKMRQATFSYCDMSIRYKNQVFAILIDIRHNNSSILGDIAEKKKRLLEECEKNNLIPCIFPLNMALGKQSGPYGYGSYFEQGRGIPQEFTPNNKDGWNLVHAVTNEPVIPHKLATDEPVQMSEYEQYNFATEIAKQVIEKEYGPIIEWNDVTWGGLPHLMYNNDKKNTEEWCNVRVVDKPVNELTENDIHKYTSYVNYFYPSYRNDGIFFLVYIKNKNRTDLTHEYQYKILERPLPRRKDN